MALEWELVSSEGTELLERTPVPGGWLYRNSFRSIDHFSIAFVPDGDSMMVDPEVAGMIDSAVHPHELEPGHA